MQCRVKGHLDDRRLLKLIFLIIFSYLTRKKNQFHIMQTESSTTIKLQSDFMPNAF